MRAALSEALERIERDLAGYGVSLDVRDEPWADAPGVDSVYLVSVAGGSTGLSLTETETAAGTSAEQSVVDVAEQVQDFVHEELCSLGLPVAWPVCPEHADGHPMAPVLSEGAACWECPAGGGIVRVIGTLGTLDERTRPVAGRRPTGP